MVGFILSFITALVSIAVVLAMGYAALVVLISLFVIIPWWIWLASFGILLWFIFTL